MTEHSTPDLFASRVPVHSALVQKSVATITNLAGRLSGSMLGNYEAIGKRETQNSWQEVCYRCATKVLRAGYRRLRRMRKRLVFAFRQGALHRVPAALCG
jgi:hypothetical protein